MDVYAFLGQRAKAVSFLRNNLLLWILFFYLYFILYFTHVNEADMFLVGSALVCIKCAMSCPLLCGGAQNLQSDVQYLSFYSILLPPLNFNLFSGTFQDQRLKHALVE